jgi:hypothetical protein
MGPPAELAALLQTGLGLTCFFETGTYLGGRAAAALPA